jgi:hypothetical protein
MLKITSKILAFMRNHKVDDAFLFISIAAIVTLGAFLGSVI